MNITTRPAAETDAAFAREAHHGAYRDVVIRQFGAWDEQVQDGFFERSWEDHRHEIILHDGVPCGYTSVEFNDDYVHVREFVIHPAFQGQGLGTAFLQGVCAQAAARGLPIKLGVFHQNRAVAFYRRLGFREYARTEMHILMEWHSKIADDFGS